MRCIVSKEVDDLEIGDVILCGGDRYKVIDVTTVGVEVKIEVKSSWKEYINLCLLEKMKVEVVVDILEVVK